MPARKVLRLCNAFRDNELDDYEVIGLCLANTDYEVNWATPQHKHTDLRG